MRHEPKPTRPTLLSDQTGRIKPMVLLWALGIPLPIVLIIALVRGC